ncbi:MAG: hypothetical protein WKF89_13490 [Chitinophagaceae bacterium]
MNILQQVLHRPFVIKLFNWEYWSFNTIYAPISIVWFWLCIKARSFFFFSASNPSILNGGFLMESKKAIYDILPAEFYPKTFSVNAQTSPAEVLKTSKSLGFNYPLIGKPDIGGRGRGVKKLLNEQELVNYAVSSQVDYLVQEFVPFENEVGLFYYRIPGEPFGHISGIVRKEFLSVTGDGVHTIRQLCLQEKRFILQLTELDKLYAEAMNEVLPAGKFKELVPYGNHARGARFIDDSHLTDEELTKSMDTVCKRVHDFYYGRLDIRFKNWEDLRQGKNFSIIELNGAGSEPTHIYDTRHSIFFAWSEIIRHWKILWRISIINHGKGVPYLTYKQGTGMLRENKLSEIKLSSQHV